MIRRNLMIAAIAMLAAADSAAVGQWNKPAVSLLPSKATAERRDNVILFRCDALLDNATGGDLTIRSNFSSVFDGLELVVTTPEGKILGQQVSTLHQAPFAPPGREFTLKQGSTKGALIFPIHDLPMEMTSCKVRLTGTLPGSNYRRILSSETLEVKVKQ